ncbi:hypothetical protein CKO45_06085 [Paracraurococcus ruber]|uniref:Uncharacterized protein n=1 Tax=Paracraurococcus ruber TaxID=77675 RepID=A0ABS1CTY2_9PROT|nr:hypothetical protein [Paracraurococcus ruber]
MQTGRLESCGGNLHGDGLIAFFPTDKRDVQDPAHARRIGHDHGVEFIDPGHLATLIVGRVAAQESMNECCDFLGRPGSAWFTNQLTNHNSLDYPLGRFAILHDISVQSIQNGCGGQREAIRQTTKPRQVAQLPHLGGDMGVGKGYLVHTSPEQSRQADPDCVTCRLKLAAYLDLRTEVGTGATLA